MNLFKKLWNWIIGKGKQLRSQFERNLGGYTYAVKFEKDLSGEQKSNFISRSIVKFPPNCKPNSLTVSTAIVIFSFDSGCLTGEKLKNICESVIERTQPVNKVISISLDGVHIWPETK